MGLGQHGVERGDARPWRSAPRTCRSRSSTLAMTSRDTARVWLVGAASAVVVIWIMSNSVSLRPAGLRSTSRTDLRCGSTMTRSISESLSADRGGAGAQRRAGPCRRGRPTSLELALGMRRRRLTASLSLESEPTQSSLCSAYCAAYVGGAGAEPRILHDREVAPTASCRRRPDRRRSCRARRSGPAGSRDRARAAWAAPAPAP